MTRPATRATTATRRPGPREQAPRAFGGGTEALLRAGERLIATNGIDTVSLRQIGAEAGSRNPSVVHYHFGSRLGLLRAIVEWRAPAINRRRIELLEQLDARGGADDIRGLVEAMARPMLEQEPDSHYVQFLARLHIRPEYDDAFVGNLELHSSIPILTARLDVALGFLPDQVRARRLWMAADLIVTTIANRRAREVIGRSRRTPDEQFADELMDALVGLLTAEHVRPT